MGKCLEFPKGFLGGLSDWFYLAHGMGWVGLWQSPSQKPKT